MEKNTCDLQNNNMISNDFDCYKIIDVAKMFLEDAASEISYQKVCDTARDVCFAKYAIFNLYEDDGKSFSSVAVSGVGDVAGKVSKILGFDIENKKWGDDPVRVEKIAEKTITKFETLKELTGKKVPRSLMTVVEKTFNVGFTYVAKIEKESKIIGDFTLICEQGSGLQNEGLMELYVQLVGMFISRKKSEELLVKSYEQYLLAVEGNHDGIWDWDLKSGQLFLSKRWKKILGYEDSEIANHIDSFRENIYDDDRPRVMQYVAKYLKGEFKHYNIEFRMKHKDGTFRWILGRGEALYDEKGIPFRMAGSHTDITEKKEMEKRLVDKHEQYMLAVEGSRDGIWDWDLKSGHLFLSKRWKEIVGYVDDELESKLGVFEDLLHPDDKERVDKYMDRYLKGEFKPYDTEFRMKHKDGTYRWIMARGEALYDEKGIPYRMAGSHTDITEKKEMEKKLESLAATDELTKLWNRRHFFNVGESECKRAVRYKAKFSMLMIDIDLFKDVNDTYGHAAGDIVLKGVAEIFIHGLRDVDIAARIGGEEFAILMPSTDTAGALIVAQRLRKNIEMLSFEHEGKKIKITISIGVAECCEKNTLDQMMQNSDEALYNAKKSGRNCVKVYRKS